MIESRILSFVKEIFSNNKYWKETIPKRGIKDERNWEPNPDRIRDSAPPPPSSQQRSKFDEHWPLGSSKSTNPTLHRAIKLERWGWRRRDEAMKFAIKNKE